MELILGYALSSEEHPAPDLVEQAVRAERAGFRFAFVSDHFHPWTDRQGESTFVWSVLGAIASSTRTLELGTGVTCPTMRIHPALVAQAAATVASLMPGRFTLGLGTGENLNEHVVGRRWPSGDERLEMLEEAIEVIRGLWRGELFDHRGRWFTVSDARLYSLPDEPPPIAVAAAAPHAAELAGRRGDALVSTSPDGRLVERFLDAAGDASPPRYGQLTVCVDDDEAAARRTAREWWPNAALQGELGQELPLPRHFEQATATLTEDDVASAVVCGADPDRHLEQLGAYADAGFTHVYVHQVGKDQEALFRLYEREIIPRVESRAAPGLRRAG